MTDRPLSVTELTRRISTALEADPVLGDCAVQGEVCNLKRHDSGHLYFSLREGTKATVPCVMWRSEARALQVALEDGMAVVARGRIGVYAPHGRYQLYVQGVRLVGAGDLWALYEGLRRKLEAEGLFAATRKRPLPRYPRAVAVISSATGAATQDMLTILARRFPPAKILLVPAIVQGSEAPASLSAALRRASRVPDVDVILIGRGGGSMEDLWCFNEEELVRQVAACPVPIISAVGHETDVTLTDFAADVRASTPSAAAELAVPDRQELLAQLDATGRRLQNALHGVLSTAREALRRRQDRVPFARPMDLLAAPRQSLDVTADALRRAMVDRLRAAGDRVERVAIRVADLGPTRTLARGYAIVKAADGRVLKAADETSVGAAIEVILARGELGAQVTAVRGRSFMTGM